jgi:predicted nucleic acid-binding protein
VEDWLDAPVACMIPQPGSGRREISSEAGLRPNLRGNLVSDAVLAALGVEHGLAVVSADSNFPRSAT